MPCDKTTHLEQAKSKKFCPDCGEKLSNFVLEQLNKYFEQNGIRCNIYMFMLNNQLILNEDIVLDNDKFYLADDFISQNPFLQFPNDFKKQINHLFLCDDEICSKKRIYFQKKIPNNLQPESKKFLNEIYDIFHKPTLNVIDRDGIIEYITKQLHELESKSKFDSVWHYILQDCLSEDGKIWSDQNDKPIDVKDIVKIDFGRCDDKIVRLIYPNDNHTVKSEGRMLKDGENKYCYKCYMHADYFEIRDWFNKRPESWIRDEKMEALYFKPQRFF